MYFIYKSVMEFVSGRHLLHLASVDKPLFLKLPQPVIWKKHLICKIIILTLLIPEVARATSNAFQPQP